MSVFSARESREDAQCVRGVYAKDIPVKDITLVRESTCQQKKI